MNFYLSAADAGRLVPVWDGPGEAGFVSWGLYSRDVGPGLRFAVEGSAPEQGSLLAPVLPEPLLSLFVSFGMLSGLGVPFGNGLN